MWQSKYDISKMGWEGDVWPLLSIEENKCSLVGKAWPLRAERPEFLIPVSLLLLLLLSNDKNSIVHFACKGIVLGACWIILFNRRNNPMMYYHEVLPVIVFSWVKRLRLSESGS